MLSFSEIIYFIVPLVIASTVPLTLVALGALYSERSGVINIALEGIMLMGAYVGAVVIQQLEIKGVNPVLNILVSIMFGMFIAYLLYTLTLYLLDKFKVEYDKDSLLFRYLVFGIEAVISIVVMYLIISNVAVNIQVALIGLIVGAIIGTMFSLFHAYAAINMKANQIISATALNMFAPAFAIFINRTFSAEGTQKVTIQESYRIPEVPLLSEIPILGDLLFKGAYLSTFLGLLIFIVAVVILYKTRYGLRLRSCGENPQAADSLGINIYKIRYSGVLVSGALAGMGGVIFVLSFASNFNATVSGFGFLALAVLIFGNWKPNRIILAALFFAFMRVISSTYSVIPFLDNLDLASELYSMLPYLATLIVLAFVSKNSAAPRAAGEPYDPGKR
jgi:simple sugar transport system permease protein